MNSWYDVIVIGAGHAGCEAAWAASRSGPQRWPLHADSVDTIGHMPCNPAIGGTAKGHLVREIDALGGLMGRAIDATGLQFKLLNRSRGPGGLVTARAGGQAGLQAVDAGGAGEAPGVSWILGRGRPDADQGPARSCGLALEDGSRAGVLCALVVTTGTFLNGLIHVGPDRRRRGAPGSHRRWNYQRP